MDLYIIMGLRAGATDAEVKRAYRRLARKYHPDVNPGDYAAEAAFRQILEAYEVLSDPERRRHYDTGGGVTLTTASSFEFRGFDFSAAAPGSQEATFGELFSEALPGQTGRHKDKPEAGADLHHAVAVPFEAAMRGTHRSLTVTRLDTCVTCKGAGRQKAEGRCTSCHGSGQVRLVRGHMVFSRECAACAGSGRQRQRVCPSCSGEGVVVRTELVSIEIPPGIADGERVRVASKGHAGRRGGRAGDLYVSVAVEPHSLFRREGNDLHVSVPVAIHEAALGARVEVPTFEGAASLRIPPGTQSRQRFRLRGRGAPSMRDGRRGDLIVEAQLVLPPILDERSKELLREFGRLNAGNVRAEMHRLSTDLVGRPQRGDDRREPAEGRTPEPAEARVEDRHKPDIAQEAPRVVRR